MQHLAQGHAELHHREIAAAAAAAQLRGCQALMLAQFSMAQAQPEVQRAVACPVLSSPDCAVLALKKKMKHA